MSTGAFGIPAPAAPDEGNGGVAPGMSTGAFGVPVPEPKQPPPPPAAPPPFEARSTGEVVSDEGDRAIQPLDYGLLEPSPTDALRALGEQTASEARGNGATPPPSTDEGWVTFGEPAAPPPPPPPPPAAFAPTAPANPTQPWLAPPSDEPPEPPPDPVWEAPPLAPTAGGPRPQPRRPPERTRVRRGRRPLPRRAPRPAWSTSPRERRVVVIVAVACLLIVAIALVVIMFGGGDGDEQALLLPIAPVGLVQASVHVLALGGQAAAAADEQRERASKPPPRPSTAGPVAAIRDHWRAIDRGDYEAAFERFAAAAPYRRATWVRAQAANRPRVRILELSQRRRVSATRALVALEVATRDRGSDRCTIFGGTVVAVRERGAWRYAAGAALGSRLAPLPVRGDGRDDPRCAPLF